MPVIFSSYWIVCVLFWIKKIFSRVTESQTQRLAADQTLTFPPENSSGSQQKPVVESQLSARKNRDSVIPKNRLIRKTRNQKNQKLESLVSELKKQLDASNLKNAELQNEHDEFVLLCQHEKKIRDIEEMVEKGQLRIELRDTVVELESAWSELEAQNQVIVDMTEKQLRLMNDDSRLRRTLDEKDRLLASKESALEILQLSFERQGKTILHLLSQLPELDCKKEEGFQQLLVIETHQNICQNVEESMQLSESISIEQPFVPEVIPAEISILEPQIGSKFSPSEADVWFDCEESAQQRDTVVELEFPRSELEAQNQVIVDMTEKQLRLINDDSRLRKTLDEKDRLLASKESALEILQLSFERQGKTILHLLSQLPELDCKKEGLQQFLVTDTHQNVEESMQLSESIWIEQPLVPEGTPAEISTPIPQTESQFLPSESEVSQTDLTSIILEELTVNQQTVIEQFQSSEAPEYVVRSDVKTRSCIIC